MLRWLIILLFGKSTPKTININLNISGAINMKQTNDRSQTVDLGFIRTDNIEQPTQTTFTPIIGDIPESPVEFGQSSIK